MSLYALKRSTIVKDKCVKTFNCKYELTRNHSFLCAVDHRASARAAAFCTTKDRIERQMMPLTRIIEGWRRSPRTARFSSSSSKTKISVKSVSWCTSCTCPMWTSTCVCATVHPVCLRSKAQARGCGCPYLPVSDQHGYSSALKDCEVA